jgi:hypothetical protein
MLLHVMAVYGRGGGLLHTRPPQDAGRARLWLLESWVHMSHEALICFRVSVSQGKGKGKGVNCV